MGLFIDSPPSLLITRIMKPRAWKTQASQLVLGSWGRWRNAILSSASNLKYFSQSFPSSDGIRGDFQGCQQHSQLTSSWTGFQSSC